MSDDFEDTPRLPVTPILVVIIVILVGVVSYQAGRQHRAPETPPRPGEVAVESSSSEWDDNDFATDTPEEEEPVAVKSGERVERKTLKERGIKLLEPILVRKEDIPQMKRSVEELKVYDSLLVWKMYGKVEDKKWGARALLNLSYGGEAHLVRTVEKNDGEEIVVLYDFQSIKSIEILCDVETVKLDFMDVVTPKVGAAIGVSSILLAPIFDSFLPGAGTAFKIGGATVPFATQAFLENLATRGYQYALNHMGNKDRIKVFGRVDSLEGKKVRVTHRDGAVQFIEPVGCDLTESERNFCANLGVLADYHIMPNLDVKVGENWHVRADHFSNMLDPSIRGIPSGALEITRRRSSDRGTATLEVTAGTIELDSSDTRTTRIGKCMPRGTLTYDLQDGFVKTGRLKAAISIDRLSKKHLLFETRFKSNPTVEIEYECSKGTEKVLRMPESLKDVNLQVPESLEHLVP